MPKIISMSLDENLFSDIENAKETTGFSGRSEMIRAGLKLLLDDLSVKDKLKGHAECVLVVVHKSKSEKFFIRPKHKYEDIIYSQLHNNLCNDKCLEIFILHGPAEKVSGFFTEIRKNKRTEYAKLLIP